MHYVELKDDKVYIYKVLSDGLPANMPTIIMSALEAYELGNDLIKLVLKDEK